MLSEYGNCHDVWLVESKLAFAVEEHSQAVPRWSIVAVLSMVFIDSPKEDDCCWYRIRWIWFRLHWDWQQETTSAQAR